MKKLSLITIACMAVLFSACSTFDGFDATNVPVNAGEAKIGTSECSWIFGFRHKDCSIDAAAKDGKITSIQSIEVQSFRTFFYDTKTIIVRGK